MSFGFSVGDIITVLELAKEIRTRFVDCPHQFKAISNEVVGLSNVLRDIKCVLCQHKLTDWQEKALLPILEECQDILNRLEKIVAENYCLKSPNSGGFQDKSRRVWKRLNWEPKEIQDFRSRITLNIGLLNAFNGNLTSKVTLATKEGVDRLHERQDTHEHQEECQAILNWLTPIDYAPQQSDFFSRRQEGTGEWLLESKEFIEWFDHSNKTLFCPGMPGAGKTIITSIVVHYLHATFQGNPTIGIAYLYCNFRQEHEQKPIDLLLNLLKQLTQQLTQEQPFIPECVKSLYSNHKDRRTRPTFNEISKALHIITANYSRAFIIIDALDECQVSNRERKFFLAEIFSLKMKTGANIFATSRFIPEIEKEFKGSILLEICANVEDVSRYLDAHMLQLPSFVSRNVDLQAEIKTAIIKVVGGMFLLAQLHLGLLAGKRSPKAVRTTLQKLPTGCEAYDHAYNDAMQRIESQAVDSRELAKEVLLWVTCAKRRLTTMELRHALAVEIGSSTFDEDNLPEIDDMVSVCAGLVIVDKESDIIRLVHYTAQDFFERKQNFWFPNAQRDIATVCITYLSFDAYKAGFCQTDNEFEARLRQNILYDYAARHWGHHAHEAPNQMGHMILAFLESNPNVSAATQAMLASSGYRGYSQRVPRQMTKVHLAAYFGLKEVLVTLPGNGYPLDFKDSYGRTPLSWAVEQGQEAVVELLLLNDAVDFDYKDRSGRTPLLQAALYGHEAIAKQLLAKDGLDPDRTDTYGQTPLWWAVENGCDAVVGLLLADNRVDPNRKNSRHITPLSWAAANGRETVVILFLAKNGVNLDPQDKYGRTPLSWAAASGHETVVKLLLAKDEVNPNSKSSDGRTPLSWAAANGQEAVIILFLAKNGVDLDPQDRYGRTPLSWATASGHETVVKLLLAKDEVNPDSKSSDGRTPLSWAAASGYEAVVKLLLAKGKVNLDSKSSTGRTPLSWAAVNGHETVVKLLLTKDGVNPDSKSSNGRTPLSWAAEKGYNEIVKLLLETNKFDLEFKDNYGRTPLSWAAANGHKAVVELFVTKNGLNLESKDNYGRTSLSWATMNGHKAVAMLLLANGVLPTDEPKTEAPLRLHDNKGEENNLRLEKERKITIPEALDDPEYSQPDVNEFDQDLLEYSSDEDEIQLDGCRIRSIPPCHLDRFKKLEKLSLRANIITKIELPSSLAPALRELDFFDNLISYIQGLEGFIELTSLDLSFNLIKRIMKLNHLEKLRDLYLVNNKISKIEELEGLKSLRRLDLGMNRIRSLEGLETLTALEELSLDKNKITELEGLDTLTNLKILSVRSNRISSLGNSLSLLTNLRSLDISNNPILHLEGFGLLRRLEELWASNCGLESFEEIEIELADKEELGTVSFDGNPLQVKNSTIYWNKVRLALPRVKQIEADPSSLE